MDDLIKRLEESNGDYSTDEILDTLNTLRAENEKLCQIVIDTNNKYNEQCQLTQVSAELFTEQLAENERLREALEVADATITSAETLINGGLDDYWVCSKEGTDALWDWRFKLQHYSHVKKALERSDDGRGK